MTTDSTDRPPRRPQTAVVAAGRTHAAHSPLNVPLVLASTFRAAPGRTPSPTAGREHARDDGTLLGQEHVPAGLLRFSVG